jgi:very-short-patch-repair endonuclease
MMTIYNTEMNSKEFPVSIDQLAVDVNSRKDKILYYIKKHFREGVHYTKVNYTPVVKKNGGQNRQDYYVTNETAELCRTTYNMKNKYVPHYKNVEQVRVLMSLENQTIGFIASSLEGVVELKRQMKIGSYFADLCFPERRIVVECDELGHCDRDAGKEHEREEYIRSKGYKIVRFNPNEANFDLSTTLRRINHLLFGCSNETETVKEITKQPSVGVTLELKVDNDIRNTQSMCTMVQTTENAVPQTSNGRISMMQRLAEGLSDEDIRYFLLNHYLLNNFHETRDYVLDSDDVAKWLGYEEAGQFVDLIMERFTQDVDYKLYPRDDSSKADQLGADRVKFTIQTFNSVCMKADTQRAHDILTYYVRLENVIFGRGHAQRKDSVQFSDQTLSEMLDSRSVPGMAKIYEDLRELRLVERCKIVVDQDSEHKFERNISTDVNQCDLLSMKHQEKMAEELTKQRRIEERMAEELAKQKRIDAEELTKQKQLDLEIMRLELEMKRLDTRSTSVQECPRVPTSDSQKKIHQKNKGTTPAKPPCTDEVMLFLIDLWIANRTEGSLVFTTSDLHAQFVEFLRRKKRYAVGTLVLWGGKAKLGMRIGKYPPEVGIGKILNYGPTHTSAYAIDVRTMEAYLVSNGLVEDEMEDAQQ